MQWLRHTRFDPPTLTEQRREIMRQEQMKVLASQADARWASKPSALDAPDKQQPVQMLKSRDPDSGVVQMNADQDIRDRTEPLRITEESNAQVHRVQEAEPQQMPRDPPVPATTGDTPSTSTRKFKKEPKEPKDSPWNQAAQNNSGQDWQPQGWTPAPARRRT
jgi:NADH dehydrogenase [ubiquinone] 1 alpha subcomplex assembly factor 2